MASSLTLSAPVSPTLANLQAFSAIGQCNILWDACTDPLYAFTECYGSYGVNDRASASLLCTVKDNSITWPLTTGYDLYIWIRAKDIYGRTLGDWFPADANLGVHATAIGVDASDIVVTTGSVDLTGADNVDLPAVNAYGDIDALGGMTYLVEGAPAIVVATYADASSVQLNSGSYNTEQTLESYSFTGNGYPMIFDWYCKMTSFDSLIPWGTITMGTSTVVYIELTMRLNNDTDSVGVFGETFTTTSWTDGTRYLMNERPSFKTVQTLEDTKDYTLTVVYNRRRGFSGTGTITGFYSTDRLLVTTEIRI